MNSRSPVSLSDGAFQEGKGLIKPFYSKCKLYMSPFSDFLTPTFPKFLCFLSSLPIFLPPPSTHPAQPSFNQKDPLTLEKKKIRGVPFPFCSAAAKRMLSLRSFTSQSIIPISKGVVFFQQSEQCPPSQPDTNLDHILPT